MPTFPSSENFLSQAPVEKSVRPRGFYKAITLDSLSVLAAIFLGFSYRFYLQSHLSIFYPIGALFLFSAFTSLELILIKKLERRACVLFLEAVGIVAFFYNLPSGILTTLFGLLLFFFVWGEIGGRRELLNAVEPSYFRIGRLKLSKVITGLALAAAFIYLPQISSKDYLLPRSAFQNVYDWSAGIINKIYPEIKTQDTAGEFIESLANYNLRKLPEFSEFPPVDQQNFVDKEAQKIAQKFNDSLKKKINLEQKTDDLIYEYVSSYLDNLRNNFTKEFRIIWGILIFFALRGFGFIFLPLASILVFAIVQILIGIGFIYVAGETRTKETLTF